MERRVINLSSMAVTQPTILVKKADGTSVRVSLAEFKKMRTSGATSATTAPAPAPTAPQPAPTTVSGEKLFLIDPTEKELPAVASEVAPVPVSAPPAPPKPNFKPRVAAAPAPKLIQEKPLLDETIAVHEVRDPGMTGRPAAITDTVVREVIRESGLVVANDLWGRTQALLLSWLRGIRGDEQFTEYATAAVDKGGLGITPATAVGLIKIMRGHKRTADNKAAPIIPIAAIAPVSLPVPKAAAPVTMQAPVQKPAPAPAPEPVPSRPAPLPSSSANVFQDVKREATTTPLTGPAEEMSTFTMADWRRLGATPEAAQTALLAKFAGWRGESFLLFMDAFTAWQDSPVMRRYQEIAVTAINQRQPVSAVISAPARSADRLSPNLAEFMAINRVNHELAI